MAYPLVKLPDKPLRGCFVHALEFWRQEDGEKYGQTEADIEAEARSRQREAHLADSGKCQESEQGWRGPSRSKTAVGQTPDRLKAHRPRAKPGGQACDSRQNGSRSSSSIPEGLRRARGQVRAPLGEGRRWWYSPGLSIASSGPLLGRREEAGCSCRPASTGLCCMRCFKRTGPRTTLG